MNARRLSPILAAGLLLSAAVYALGAPARAPAPAAPTTASPAAQVSPFELDGTRIVVRKADGAVATDDELVGAVLVGTIDGGIKSAFRIDGAEVDPQDPSGELVLYSLSVKDQQTGAWKNACTPDARGVAKGFPLAGTWTRTGAHVRARGQFELACTSGALGKCVRLGYKPWQDEAMWDRHQACVRMVRADYCGDGTGHTRNGTPIDVYDEAGIQVRDPAGALRFEAGWGKDGATCVRKTRVEDVATLADIVAACPSKLGAKSGDACDEEEVKRDPGTLLLNGS